MNWVNNKLQSNANYIITVTLWKNVPGQQLMIDLIAYTLAGIILYFGSDWILDQIENAVGRKFDNRNLIFFGIILILALSSFAAIRMLAPE